MATKSNHVALSLRLYVTGDAPNSIRAVANARSICKEYFPGGHQLEIVDLVEHPERAMDDGIVVTPTLLKLLPMPRQRIIGNLNDTQQVLLALSAK